MKFELTKDYIDKIRSIIEGKDEKTAVAFLHDLHPADIAEIYDELSIDEAKFLYLLMDGDKAADVLAELEEDDRQKFLKILPPDVIARRFIADMDSDDAADVLGEMEEDRQEEVLNFIEDIELAGDIMDLLHYDEHTAGGLMAKELIAVNENWSVPTCIKELRKQAEEVDEVYYVYVIDDDEKLKGTLSLKRMLLSPSVNQVSNIYKPDPISVKTDTDSEEVAQIMEKYDLVALPVIDSIGRLVGRITIDDVVDVIRQEAEKDYQMASGLTQDVETTDTVFKIIRARLPWLLIGLFGGICGAMVIGVFEGNLTNYPQMAFFIPLIGAMGGNVGIQSSAIIVQGLASNSLGLESTWKKIFKELLVALFNATILSLLIFTYNYFISHDLPLTFSVTVALFSVVLFASLFGTIVPLSLNRFKIDPALATGPFITTVNDIIGLLIYMRIGQMFFKMYS